MLIQWITIVEFRSYSLLSFKPDPGLNVLSGPNAQGKTNLLEAMGLLLVGRSFRGPWCGARSRVKSVVALPSARTADGP